MSVSSAPSPSSVSVSGNGALEKWLTLLQKVQTHVQVKCNIRHGQYAPYIGANASPPKLYTQQSVTALCKTYGIKKDLLAAPEDYTEIYAAKFEARDHVGEKRNIGKDHENLMAAMQALTGCGLHLLRSEFIVASTELAVNDNPTSDKGGNWIHPLGVIDMVFVSSQGELVVGDLKTMPPPAYNPKKLTVEQYLLRQNYFFQMEMYSLLLEHIAKAYMPGVKVAYHVLILQDTYPSSPEGNGSVKVFRIERNPQRWLGAKGLEEQRYNMLLPFNFKVIPPPTPAPASAPTSTSLPVTLSRAKATTTTVASVKVKRERKPPAPEDE